MKKLLAALALASTAFFNLGHAQTPVSKQEWAAKVVALQQGPELDRLIAQLADSATEEVLQNWGQKLQADVPAARQQQAKDELNAELKKLYDDITRTIKSKVIVASGDALVPAYMEKFSIDELKQIATFFESPAVKKYQAAAPELGASFVKQLVEITRADVTGRVKQFDDSAAKIIGSTSAPSTRAAPSTPATSGTARPAPKK
ncbi:MAG: DUF2059 domain-containing protein [Polaromonas sp.]|uniref:DUF2059 domain-containing protein n=1 Tax=Polaromonas sp. TaxID=1869339 RepID=UPI0025F05943|nr:DUF2059 domain-containing protein [Polaromonas sp.]MBI2726494.1 DUF2059 domain-containing protein [Polaromonas sp.]